MSTATPQAPDGKLYYRIEDVAGRTGVTRRTLRYYEEIGLLAPPARTEGNYRLYTEADIARLEYIRQLKDALGLSLKEIAQMTQAENELEELRATYRSQQRREQRRETLGRAEDVTQRQIALIAGKVAALGALDGALHERLTHYAQRRIELDAE